MNDDAKNLAVLRIGLLLRRDWNGATVVARTFRRG
jgi:hypothetical protein